MITFFIYISVVFHLFYLYSIFSLFSAFSEVGQICSIIIDAVIIMISSIIPVLIKMS